MLALKRWCLSVRRPDSCSRKIVSSNLKLRTASAFALLFLACFRPETAEALHSFGPRIEIDPAIVIGPDSGELATEGNEWSFTWIDNDAFFLILRMRSNIDDGDKVTIDLGYGVDEFSSPDVPVLYSRPIGGTSATITYHDMDSNNEGSVELIGYGRGDVIDVFGVSDPCTPQEPGVITSQGVCPFPLNPLVPSWENVACFDDDIITKTSKSVGLFVFLTSSDTVSSCTATLIDENTLLTSGHCIGHAGEEVDIDGYRTVEVNSASFTFDFETDCDGDCPVDYSPKFFKVESVVRSKYVEGVAGIDYAFIVLNSNVISHAEANGIEPIPMNNTDGLSVGDEVFLIHHPTGRAKKVSNGDTDPGSCEILGFTFPDGIRHIIAGCDIDNGSSGSSMFLASTGELIANCDLFNWADCGGRFILTSEIINNFKSEDPPEQDVDVMLVLDRSGSMNELTELGNTKMQELREAASLFVDLLNLAASHAIGLVSFSSSASLDYDLTTFDTDVKDNIIEAIAGLTGSGATSIGGGLQTAQSQFTEESTNKPSILLMTDGLQNTPPLIQNVADQLDDTSICTVGFGTDANLNGVLLGQLASDTNGLYTRASSGLELKKFFSLCFGNIFNNNIAFDPFDCIPKGEVESQTISFTICDETELTVVAGWDTDAILKIKLTSPSGTDYYRNSLGVVGTSEGTYAFLRIELPFNGESKGTWQALLIRETRPIPRRFQTQERDVCYFLASLVRGGPELILALKESGKTYYTGDPLVPIVALQSQNNAIIGPAIVGVTVTRPTVGAGELLSENVATVPQPPIKQEGNITNPRADALRPLQSSLTYTEQKFKLLDHDHKLPVGPPEPKLVFWNKLDIAKFEGEYTFHAMSHYGRENECQGRRELTWTVHVDVGIDPDETTVDVTVFGNKRDHRHLVRFVVVPKDKFGRRLGPYRLGAFSIEPLPGTSIVQDSLVDNKDGSYRFNAFWDNRESSSFCPTSHSVKGWKASAPRVLLKQPGRDPVVIAEKMRRPPGRPLWDNFGRKVGGG